MIFRTRILKIFKKASKKAALLTTLNRRCGLIEDFIALPQTVYLKGKRNE